MKYLALIWSGLWRKPARTWLTLISVACAFVLFGLLQGFAFGLSKSIAGAQSDLLLTSNRSNQVDPLPFSHLAEIRTLPGVSAATAAVRMNASFQRPEQPVRAFAVEPEVLGSVDTKLAVSKDQFAALKSHPSGAIVADDIALRYGWKLGDRVPLTSELWIARDGSRVWPVDIVAIFHADPENVPFGTSLLLNYNYLDQGRAQSRGTTTFIFTKASDPRIASDVAQRIDDHFANSPNETRTDSMRELATSSTRQLGDMGAAVSVMTIAVFFALLLSVGAVLMQGLRERTGELGVLKTLGFSDGKVLWIVLSETVMLCMCAAVAGLGIATALVPLVKKTTKFDIEIGPAALYGLVVALLLALVTGALPASRAMRLRIVDALRA